MTFREAFKYLENKREFKIDQNLTSNLYQVIKNIQKALKKEHKHNNKRYLEYRDSEEDLSLEDLDEILDFQEEV